MDTTDAMVMCCFLIGCHWLCQCFFDYRTAGLSPEDRASSGTRQFLLVVTCAIIVILGEMSNQIEPTWGSGDAGSR